MKRRKFLGYTAAAGASVMLNDNPHNIMAGTRDGARSILVGIAARKSIKEKRPVKISELTDLAPMANRF